MTTQRERFEAFAKDQGWSIKRWKENGQRARAYQHVTVRAAWVAWQEAERQMIERCAALCDELDQDGNTDDYRQAARWCTERIRMMGDRE